MIRPPIPSVIVFVIGAACIVVALVLWWRDACPPWALTIDGRPAGSVPYGAAFLPVPVPLSGTLRFEARRADCTVRTAVTDHVIDYIGWRCFSATQKRWGSVGGATSASSPEPLPKIRFVAPGGTAEYWLR
jgi:hypothetical protein